MAGTGVFGLPHDLHRVLILLPTHVEPQLDGGSWIDGLARGHKAARPTEIQETHRNVTDELPSHTTHIRLPRLFAET